MTPIKTARAWAAEHPDCGAKIYVKSRGRTYTYVALADGWVVSEKFYHDGATLCWNGVCYICGRHYRDAVVRQVWGADPEANLPVDGADYPAYMRGKTFRAPQAIANACPDCCATHGLAVDERAGMRHGWQGERFLIARRHPLEKFTVSEVWLEAI